MSENENKSEDGLKLMLSFVLSNKDTDASRIGTNIDENFSKSPMSMSHSTNTVEESITAQRVENFGSHITKRILNFEDPTLIVNVGAFAFRVNMEVLEIYSEYIRKNNQLNEISLPDEEVSPTAFVALYEWMIADNPGLPRKGIVELYKAALYLGIPEFIEQFWVCVSNPLINEDRAYILYLEAMAFEAPDVRRAMLNRLSRFFLIIVSCEEFLHIPVDDLAQLLKSSLISVNSEVEVYMSCVRYLNFDWNNRHGDLLTIMRLIRYDFLPTNFVLELLNEGSDFDVPEVTRIVRHTELQDVLRDLVHYHCLTAFPGPSIISVQKSLHRNWIFDPECNYHSRENPRKTIPEYVNYMDFSSYMKFLSLSDAKHWESFEYIEVESGPTNDEKIVQWELFR